jgi:alanyl-tRNA synthetase
LDVNSVRRSSISRNHSATHLLHEGLRQVLGDHVAQKGSLVSADRLRFDFSHQKSISADELATIESITNEVVLQSNPVTTRVMGVDDAVEAGARALFGEKYGDEVRVVAMGEQIQGSDIEGQFSVELCGGTHVANTGEIGLVTVIGESSVSAGVRRIEALTGDAARDYFRLQESNLKAAASVLKVSPSDVASRVAQLVEERKQLEKELSDTKRQLAMGGSAKGDGPEEINGIKFMGKVVEGISGRELKALADDGKSSLGSGIVVFVGIDSGKAGVVVGVTADLTDKYSAVDLVRAASEALGGKGGGGRPDMAQAGGPDVSKADDALAAAKALI